MCNEINMTRTYTLKRRAEQQAETRRRIVEAAVDLHTSVGPARTSLSMIAERAGVQRHTLYAHFPDDRSLFLACSGLRRSAIRCPMPSPGAPSATESERLRTGLRRSMAGLSATRYWPPACCGTPNFTRSQEKFPRCASARFSRPTGRFSARAERQAALDSAAGAELPHMADTGARSRPGNGRCRGGHGPPPSIAQ